MRKFDLVVTTIYEPTWLSGYLENLMVHGHADSVTLRVIADRKTPASVYEAAEDAARKGFAVDCPDLDEQQRYLGALGVPDGFVPWDSDNRRNVGFLRAWEHGADVLISIDDDNYCRDDSDFIESHDVVGRPAAGRAGARVAAGAPWYNICELLHADTASTIYPRGYPYGARGEPGARIIDQLPGEDRGRTVAINAGLWLEDPDVDAITRLAQRPAVDRAQDTDVLLAPGTWSPVNSQNTAIAREAIPAYYYVRMGASISGTTIDRFGDIWSGYFLQRCTEHLGALTRVGSPVADHRRTSHNLFKDLYQELAGIVLTEELLPWLREVPLSETTYASAYAELAELVDEQAGRFSGFLWDEGGREFLRATAGHMRTWLDALQSISGR